MTSMVEGGATAMHVTVWPAEAERQAPFAVQKLHFPVVTSAGLIGVLFLPNPPAAPGALLDPALAARVARHVEDAISLLCEPAVATASTDRPGTVLIQYMAQTRTVFANGEYVIRGVAGLLLRLVLAQYLRNGRCDFSNRELRLDPQLRLLGNLELRLLMLERRLAERQFGLRIHRYTRGRFRLHVTHPISMSEM